MRVVEDFPRAVRVIENTWIPLSDGARLAARIWLPEDAASHPVPGILEYIPYRKRDLTRGRDEPVHRYMAGHGYASVRVDLRGSGDSDGVLLDEYLEQEHDDAVEVIAWIARQPWCTGQVGMMGISWGGFNALQVAARRPPELGAIITLCSTDDRYADDAHYMGGCLLNENLLWGSVFLTYNALPPDPEIVGERWPRMWMRRLEHSVLFPEVWLRHQRRDAYWRRGSVCEEYGRIRCPVYAVGGWADGYSNAVPRLLAGLEVPTRGLVGPWSHDFPHESRPGPRIGFLQEAVRWWDHWLKGIETGVMEEPAYRVWMQEGVRPRTTYEERPGRWVAEDGWPSSRIREVPWRLRLGPGRPGGWLEGQEREGGGDPGREDPDIPSVDPDRGIPVRSPLVTGLGGGDWCAFGSEGEMPGDQREDDGRSICFDSPPLGEELEILGAPRIVLEMASDRPHSQVAVRLNEVFPDGASLRVTYGLLNLAHRDGHDRPRPLEPGRRYRMELALNHVAHHFSPGSRLRVAISSVYWPIAWPSASRATLDLRPDGSQLHLPVRPSRSDDAKLSDFAPPEAASSLDHSVLRPDRFRRLVERDLAEGRVVYRVTSDWSGYEGAGLARIDEIDLDVGHTIHREYRTEARDPTGAEGEVDQRILLRRGDWDVRVATRVHLGCDADTFRLEGELRAESSGEEVFRRSWSPEIPRDHL